MNATNLIAESLKRMIDLYNSDSAMQDRVEEIISQITSNEAVSGDA